MNTNVHSSQEKAATPVPMDGWSDYKVQSMPTDEQISHQSDQVHDEKEGKEWFLVLRARRESQEDEFRESC